MDISGYSVKRILSVCQSIFACGNHANFQVRGDIYPAVCVSHMFHRKGHAVEWRYDDFANIWISNCPMAVSVSVTSREDVSRLQEKILLHGILCVRLTAVGPSPVNYLWECIRWCCSRGFRLEHRTFGGLQGEGCLPSFPVVRVEVILRKPFETIDVVDMEE